MRSQHQNTSWTEAFTVDRKGASAVLQKKLAPAAIKGTVGLLSVEMASSV